jgi:hypothetical protein
MARRKVNKATKIREAFEQLGHDARPKDVVALLAKKKIKVSSTQVSTLKGKLGGSRKNGSDSKDAGISLDALLAAKHFVEKIGSIGEAKAAVDALGKLLN